jgi:hypothetical protein
MNPYFRRSNPPKLVAHADWGSNAAKRSLSISVWEQGRYTAMPPLCVEEPRQLVQMLRGMAGPAGSILLGFDFPIGLPQRYAENVGIKNFPAALPLFGRGDRESFYQPAAVPGQINLCRPFYPAKPGGARQKFLVEGLEVGDIQELRRQCELAHPGRRAASPLFWTLGPQQVGKAAISGWRDVIGPALRDPHQAVHLWPFDGSLSDLLERGALVIAETYPGEIYKSLQLNFPSATELNRRFANLAPILKSGKRSQAARLWNAPRLLHWAEAASLRLDPQLEARIQDGFGPGPNGEDPFDATVGLFGMLNVLFGFQPEWPPSPQDGWLEITHSVEGWILGQVELPTWLLEASGHSQE